MCSWKLYYFQSQQINALRLVQNAAVAAWKSLSRSAPRALARAEGGAAHGRTAGRGAARRGRPEPSRRGEHHRILAFGGKAAAPQSRWRSAARRAGTAACAPGRRPVPRPLLLPPPLGQDIPQPRGLEAENVRAAAGELPPGVLTSADGLCLKKPPPFYHPRLPPRSGERARPGEGKAKKEPPGPAGGCGGSRRDPLMRSRRGSGAGPCAAERPGPAVPRRSGQGSPGPAGRSRLRAQPGLSPRA